MPSVTDVLQGVSPWIPIIGSLIGGNVFGGQTDMQKSMLNKIMGMTDTLQGSVSTFGPRSNRLLTSAEENLNTAANPWLSLTQGSRTAQSPFLNSAFQQIDEQNNSILQGTKGSRTGAGASIYAAAPYAAAQQKQGLVSNLLAKAPGELANIGTQQGQLGNQTLYALVSSLGQAIQGAGRGLEQANTAFDQSKKAGQSFISSLQNAINPSGASGASGNIGELVKKIGSWLGLGGDNIDWQSGGSGYGAVDQYALLNDTLNPVYDPNWLDQILNGIPQGSTDSGYSSQGLWDALGLPTEVPTDPYAWGIQPDTEQQALAYYESIGMTPEDAWYFWNYGV